MPRLICKNDEALRKAGVLALYILFILSISGAMQEIPDTSDKFGLDCIVDGSIPAGNLDNNELLMCGPYFHFIEDC